MCLIFVEYQALAEKFPAALFEEMGVENNTKSL